MANVRVITSLLDYTPTADSMDSTWPVTNVKVITNLLRKWSAAVATGIVNVTLDFGAGNTLSGLAANPGILIDDANVTSIRIQGNSITTDWVTPPWDQAVTILQEGQVRRFKDFRRLLDLSASAFAYRYLNIRILSQTPTDGANYRIGRVCVGQIKELSNNPMFQIGRRLERDILETPFIGGGGESNLMGELFQSFTFPFPLTSAAGLADFQALTAVYGNPFVLWDAARGGSQDGWLVKQVAPAQLSQRFTTFDETTIALQEVI